MFSIKKSFADCSTCPLLNAPSCILETNCKDDLSKVDVVFIAENPGNDEVSKEIPLIGRAGQTFRKPFKKFGIDKMNYLLTNCVLCQTLNPDGTTGNPTEEVIERCKVNCINIIDICKPKLIVVMGASPMMALGIAKSGITNLHGNVVTWNGYKTVVIVHPSFVNRNSKVWVPKFEEAMGNIARMLGSNAKIEATDTNVNIKGEGIHRYKIPDHFYTNEYRLVDVQFLNSSHKVLYIFRDRNNKKVVYKETDDYYCYQIKSGKEARKMVPYDHLNQVLVKYKDRYGLDPEVTYEGDVRITTKHAMDYYYYNKEEAPKVKSNIMFFDIEVDTGDKKVFPKPTESKFPINMITTSYNGRLVTFVLDNKTEPIKKFEGVELKIFDNEKDMMTSFIKYFKGQDPDFASGWNAIGFDFQYIYNRLPQLGIVKESISKYNEFYVDGEKYICHIPGCVAIDQDFLYKMFTFTKMENYKLGFIAQHELGITKIDLPLSFNEMYWKMLNKTIEYNIRDTELLEKLDNKLKHINLLNELRIICNTSFDSVSSFGQIDSLMVSYLKNKGLSSKNSDPHIVKERYPGAYVFEPVPGAYDWITDFDFASLYPSIMITYNIGINSFVMKTKDMKLGYELAYCPDKLPDKIEVIVDPLYEKKAMIVTKENLLQKIKADNLVFTINGCFFKPHKKILSDFGEVVDMLMVTRKDYKKKMFDAIEKNEKDNESFFHTRQLVYKVLANTLYGVVANIAFRFYDNSLAAAITTSGQEALKTSIIEGDAFLRHLNTNKPYVSPKQITKSEMYADPKTEPEIYYMPDRKREYILTGDTDSIFTYFGNFKDVSIENINSWCKKVESFLNNDKIVEVVKRHNSDLDYNRLKLKNELIISRGLFLAKKRYAIRVVANEGKKVDKINYMGVEIKRSDYPHASKEFLSELTEMLLKEDKFRPVKVFEFIHRKERDFIRMIAEGDKRIARPVSFGKKIEDYKTISQGVKAMTAWNELFGEVHVTGAKAYMFWVRGIDFDKIKDENQREELRKNYSKFLGNGGKLEVVAIPDEEPKLPDFFIVDSKATLKFTFTDRYELFMKPLSEVGKKPVLLTV